MLKPDGNQQNLLSTSFLMTSSQVTQIREPNKPRGLLKALFKRFGVDLKGLQGIPGVQKIHVEFRNHELKIQSSEEARETINHCVEECCKNLPQQSSLSTLDDQTQLTCCICVCDVDGAADLYRLACCGHTFYKSCVIQQLKSEVCIRGLWRALCVERFAVQNLLSEKERKKLAVLLVP